MGPCSVYMKKVDSAISDPGTGDGWFKLWDQGYDDASSEKWCTRNLIANKGLMTIMLPKGLVGGNYLVRPELLALHNADKGDPQYYSGCAQIFLASSGSLVPDSTVAIPGYVTKSDPADSFDIWATPPYDGSVISGAYPIPGPPVANFSSTGTTRQTTQTEGQKPADCILESGTWCGVEVPDYSDETGCWAAGENCWTQNDACWKAAPATGGSCKIWNDKCTDLNTQCTNKNFQGPPNKGKDLTPPKSTISPPAPLGPTAGGNAVAAPTVTASYTGMSSSSTPAGGIAASSVSTVSPLAKNMYSAPYGNYSVPVSALSKTPVAPASTMAAAQASTLSAAPVLMSSAPSVSSIPYEESTPVAPVTKQLSTPAAAISASMGECYVETATVTVQEVETETVTVYASSSVAVKAVETNKKLTVESGDDKISKSSTPVAPVSTLSVSATHTPIKPTVSPHFHKPSFSRNSTFIGYTSGYAVPSGFKRLPKHF
jgi:hypothetical protein